MTRTIIKRDIAAPIELVFETVSDIGNFSKAIPHIIDVEFLSETTSGVGTRFRETRRTGSKNVATELEVTEFIENDHVRIVADSHGTVWDTLFTVEPLQGRTELTMAMEARAYELLPRLINPLMKGVIRKVIAKDMDAVKAYCEQQTDSPS